MKKIINFFLIVPLVLTLYSCGAPSFVIKPLGDKFSDPNLPTVGSIGKFNRLSTKSSMGGVHIDEKGVYIDPFVFKDKQSNEVVSVGFSIIHLSSDISSGFNPIEEIVFITNKDERISLNIRKPDFNYDSYGSDSVYSESGIADISMDDFMKLINAEWLEAKITGRKRIQTYDKDEISNEFLINLKSFYDSAIK